jgi:hypothetical protein
VSHYLEQYFTSSNSIPKKRQTDVKELRVKFGNSKALE